MSRLEKLIQELCPDGVEYKRFDEVCSLHARIGWQRLTKAEYKPYGDYLLITGTDFTDSHEINYQSCVFVSKERYIQDPHIQLKNGDVLITKDGTLGKVAQVKNLTMPATLNGGVFVVRCKDNSLENRFIFYYLLSDHFKRVVEQQKTGSTISHLTQALFSRLTIPVPPLEVQQEIVCILDNFTEFTTGLTTGLTAELTARKQQFEYYCDKLICLCGYGNSSLPDRWKETTLGEIGTLTRGKRFVKADSEGLMTGVPCIHYGELYTYYGIFANKTKSFVSSELAKKLRFAKPGDVVIVGAGENNNDIGVGVAWMGTTDVAVHDACYIFKHNENPKFISYYLRTSFYHNQLKKYVSEGKICSISADGIGKSVIFLPPIEIQNKIVDILDNFDKLFNELSNGIAAEIEARQKQYEYYRDKLLTFKEKMA